MHDSVSRKDGGQSLRSLHGGGGLRKEVDLHTARGKATNQLEDMALETSGTMCWMNTTSNHRNPQRRVVIP